MRAEKVLNWCWNSAEVVVNQSELCISFLSYSTPQQLGPMSKLTENIDLYKNTFGVPTLAGAGNEKTRLEIWLAHKNWPIIFLGEFSRFPHLLEGGRHEYFVEVDMLCKFAHGSLVLRCTIREKKGPQFWWAPHYLQHPKVLRRWWEGAEKMLRCWELQISTFPLVKFANHANFLVFYRRGTLTFKVKVPL